MGVWRENKAKQTQFRGRWDGRDSRFRGQMGSGREANMQNKANFGVFGLQMGVWRENKAKQSQFDVGAWGRWSRKGAMWGFERDLGVAWWFDMP